MKKLILLVLCVVGVSAQTGPTRSLDIENIGNDFLSQCSILLDADYTERMYNQGHCIGYMDGILDGFDLAVRASSDSFKNLIFCQPATVTRGQAVRIVLKYMTNHPETLHKATSFLIVEALHDAFPCKR